MTKADVSPPSILEIAAQCSLGGETHFIHHSNKKCSEHVDSKARRIHSDLKGDLRERHGRERAPHYNLYLGSNDGSHKATA